MKKIYLMSLIFNLIACEIDQGKNPLSSTHYKDTIVLNVANQDFINAISTLNSQAPISIHQNLGNVYVITNETGLSEVRTALKMTSKVHKSCHIGTAGWYNFDIMSLRKSSYAIIFDYNPNNAIFMNISMALVVASENRHHFIDKMIDFIVNSKSIKIDSENNKEIVARIKGELDREGSWLKSDESFAFIKEKSAAGRIACLTNTITNPDIFRKMKRILDDNYIAVDTIYLSNIRAFISDDNKSLFVESLSSIIEKDTLVINCPSILSLKNQKWSTWNLHQTVKNGEHLKKHPDEFFNID